MQEQLVAWFVRRGFQLLESFRTRRSWEEQEEHDGWFPFLRVSSAGVAARRARQGSSSAVCSWGRQMEVGDILDHITVTTLLQLKLSCLFI